MWVDTDTTWAFDILIVARRTDADNESAAYEIKGCIDNNAGAVALVSAVTIMPRARWVDVVHDLDPVSPDAGGRSRPPGGQWRPGRPAAPLATGRAPDRPSR